MKLSDLTKEQIERRADRVPYWMATRFPEWMADNRPHWMAKHHRSWMEEHFPDLLARCDRKKNRKKWKNG